MAVFLTIVIHLLGIYSLFCAAIFPDSFWRRCKNGDISWSVLGPLHGGSRRLLREAASPGEVGNTARVSLLVLMGMLMLFPVTLVTLCLLIGFQRFSSTDYGEAINVVQIKAHAESLVKQERDAAFRWEQLRGNTIWKGTAAESELLRKLTRDRFPEAKKARVEGTAKQAGAEIAPDVADRGRLKRAWVSTVGCMIVRVCGVALCQATVLIENRLWALPQHAFTKGLKELSSYMRCRSK